MKFTPKPAACQGCPAYEWGLGFVPTAGPLRASLYVLGQGPGEQEAAMGTPFVDVAPSGSMLNEWLHGAGLSRSRDVAVGNLVQCWLPKSKGKGGPKGNREPTAGEVEFCWRTHSGPTLDRVAPKIVLTVGAPASRHLLGPGFREQQLGTFNEVTIDVGSSSREGPERHSHATAGSQHLGSGDKASLRPGDGPRDSIREVPGRDGPEPHLPNLRPQDLSSPGEVSVLQYPQVVVVPLLHPSAVVRGRWGYEPAQAAYVQNAANALRTGSWPRIDIRVPPPGTKLYAAPVHVKEMHRALSCQGGTLVIDIESAGDYIMCVGLGRLGPGAAAVSQVLVVRFRVMGGGSFYHSQAALEVMVEALWELLADPKVPKLFHNGISYDVGVLERHGFVVGGDLLDTMQMAHTAYVEMPKSLQFLSTLHLGAPVWKTLVDDEPKDS